MIRNLAQALVFLAAFLFIVAEVQQLDEMNQPTVMWRPN
jgi:hypothetical protein